MVISESELVEQTLSYLKIRDIRSQRKAILRLSDWLGRDRRNRPLGYMNQPSAMHAYLCYYFPRQAALFRHISITLQKEHIFETSGKLDILDLGCGPLSATAGIMQTAEVGSVTAVDISRSMAQHGKNILSGLQSDLKDQIHIVKHHIQRFRPRRHFDLILVGHVMNEVNVRHFSVEQRAKWLTMLTSFLKPGGVLILTEPALKSAARLNQHVRDKLVSQRRTQVCWPCPDGRTCPLLIEAQDWCFQQYEWAAREPISTLKSALPFKDNILKASIFVLGEKPSQNRPRVVSDVMKTPSGRAWYICTEDGLEELTVLGAKQKNSLLSKRRGEALSWKEYLRFE